MPRSLVEQINHEHQLCESSVHSALEHGRRAGTLLIEAKAKVRHGQWLPWLADNFAGSERTAQAYMRIARELPNPQAAADLTLEGALKRIAKPKTIEAPEGNQLHDELEAQIQAGLDRGRRDLKKLYDGRADIALGHKTWDEFVMAEFAPTLRQTVGVGEVADVLLADMLAVGHDEAAELAAALGRPREPSERHPYFTNLDLYMPHHRLPDVGALDTIGGVCRAANVEPLIENVESRDSTFSHVWVGYMDDQTLVYHPGWLNYCVETGGTVARGVMDALGSEGGES